MNWPWITKQAGDFWNRTVLQTYCDEVQYVATPTLALIKVAAERTSLRVETEEIKSTWPEGNYDSLMLFWLWCWDFSFFFLRGARVSSCFTTFQESHTVWGARNEEPSVKHQQPPSPFHCSANTWPNTRRSHLSIAGLYELWGQDCGAPKPIQLAVN